MPSCSCIEAGDGALSPSVSWTDTATARKEHSCCECGRVIQVGEKYENTRGVWDGRFDVYKTCAECAEIRSALLCTWSYCGLWEDVYHGLDLGWSWQYVPWSVVGEMQKPARDSFCDWLESLEYEDDEEKPE